MRSPLVGAVVVAAAWGLFEFVVVHAGERGLAVGLFVLACEGIGFLGSYAAVLLLIAPGAIAELRKAVKGARSAPQPPEVPSLTSTKES